MGGRKQACVRPGVVDPEGAGESKANRSHVGKLLLDLGLQTS